MTTSNPKGTALITGASRGIGAVYADRLANRGYDRILVARDASRLEQLTAKLKRETGRAVTLLTADLSNRTELAKVEDVSAARGLGEIQ
jgi:short-subunit dehydrogenase